MISEISSVELHYLINELQFLVDAKVDQIYQPEKEELILQFHKTGKGKVILRIIRGKYLYLTEHKGVNPERPPGYCTYLRKKIKGMRLREIKQIGTERIVELLFESREEKYKLILEFFNKGNIILMTEENLILSPLELQRWADRTIRPKVDYVFDERINLKTLTTKQTKTIMKESKQESLVKCLATDFGLGGTWAEEVCLISSIDKTIKPGDADEVELTKAIQLLLGQELKPNIVRKGEKVIDILPIDLKQHDKDEKEFKATFNEALDSILTDIKIERAEKEAHKESTKGLSKVQKIIDSQNKIIKQLNKSITENQEKGELIYNNYKQIDDILNQILKARETMSWKEIKEKLKDHKIIKNIDEKHGKISIEI
ncbi:hypothetical protein HN419_00270 [Candidatus Woesearchaeota archaeon]|jgi:predicted ribosome quality control (RQC) complex YloA/Tae2 family protein|nr:hypothetical protein [Candidatus Woesearchaeota archaeon]MBT3538419.1 hypothetical protein [Candidatus Woesearchaeota archaeon]MBT4696869.1 hypothetical protein [Candidatus Woesearchaeota archaeon]MBT7106125.1 hypothetical protein [Candidatus Woesearchaeota archaeon]MBT7930977.1 hypothetical protein [Candidatus Woesearchaeota archaeon]